jgi:hypothetical protein
LSEWGVSWQVVPTALDQLLSEGTEEMIARVTQAFLQMKKFDTGGVSHGDLTREGAVLPGLYADPGDARARVHWGTGRPPFLGPIGAPWSILQSGVQATGGAGIADLSSPVPASSERRVLPPEPERRESDSRGRGFRSGYRVTLHPIGKDDS